MILLDTHVWVWWANNDARLSTRHKRLILQHAATGIGLSAISMWEFAMLEARGRLMLSQSPQAQKVNHGNRLQN